MVRITGAFNVLVFRCDVLKERNPPEELKDKPIMTAKTEYKAHFILHLIVKLAALPKRAKPIKLNLTLLTF